MMPLAQIVHSSPSRLRLKIAGRRGDRSYFGESAKKLASAFAQHDVQANASTGSIVFSGDGMDAGAVVEYGRVQGLFQVRPSEDETRLLSGSILMQLQAVDRNVKTATSGRLDLPGFIFLALLLFGFVELIRGNWRSPPWYTAFWYASGLYSKSIIDQVASGKAVDTG